MAADGRDTAGRFTLGSHGNPNGRPRREKCVTDHLRRLLAEAAAEGRSTTFAEVLARLLLQQALHGDRHALEQILNRVEGRPALTFVDPADPGVVRIIRSPVPIPDFLRGATFDDEAKGEADDGPGDGS